MNAPTVPPLVTVSKVQLAFNKKHHVTHITVSFSGAVGAAGADALAAYHLTTAGKRGSFTAKSAKSIKLKSAVYSEISASVTLTPKKPFALSTPVQLLVSGLPPSGLTDDLGRLIDGNRDGQPGGDAMAILSKRGVSIVVSRQQGPLVRLSVAAADRLMSSQIGVLHVQHQRAIHQVVALRLHGVRGRSPS